MRLFIKLSKIEIDAKCLFVLLSWNILLIHISFVQILICISVN